MAIKRHAVRSIRYFWGWLAANPKRVTAADISIFCCCTPKPEHREFVVPVQPVNFQVNLINVLYPPAHSRTFKAEWLNCAEIKY
ncbi:MAG: hypothetical protein DRI46_08145 [Chloroflexi bacterium]|nr:MAG: hypothetical protein DRI46_08145 [Chloroflexota bacterium]